MTIYESLVAAPGSCIVVINIERTLFKYCSNHLQHTYLVQVLQHHDKLKCYMHETKFYNKYNAVVHLYCSAHLCVFSHMVPLFFIKTLLFCNSPIIHLLCESVVLEYCLISFDKKEEKKNLM